MTKKRIKALSILLAVVMMVTVYVSVPAKAEAADAASINTFQVQDRVTKLNANYSGTYFTNVNGVYGKKDLHSKQYHRTTYCRYCDVVNVVKTQKIRNEYTSGVSTGYMPYHALSPSRSGRLGDSCFGFVSYAGYYIFGNGKNVDVDGKKIGTYTYSKSNLTRLKSVLRVGDMIRFDSAHSVIYYGKISNSGMVVIDSNWGSTVCKVSRHTVPFGCGYGKITIYRGANRVNATISTPSVTAINTNKSTDGLKVSWDSVAGANQYMVYRSTKSSSGYVRVATVTASKTEYIDSNVDSGKYYYYKVKAANSFYGGTYYTAASSYKAGKWTAAKYTINYNANGGTGAPADQIKTQKSTLTLSKTKPTKSGFVFMGWSTSQSAKTASYVAGGAYKTEGSRTLYAVWLSENDMSFKTVTISPTLYTYNGTAKKPTVTAKDGAILLNEISDYTVTYPTGSTNVGKYTITVNGMGKYSGSKAVTFKINPKGTALISLSARTKALTAKWSKQSTQTTGYQVIISRSSKFTSPKIVTISGSSNVSKTIKTTYAKKRYYAKVRTYKTISGVTYYSTWSSARSVVTK